MILGGEVDIVTSLAPIYMLQAMQTRLRMDVAVQSSWGTLQLETSNLGGKFPESTNSNSTTLQLAHVTVQKSHDN